MKAIGFSGGKSIVEPDVFVSIESETPVPGDHDLLVAIRAIAVNPVDTKIRIATTEVQDPPKILGWDAAGIIEAVGNNVTLFQPGDAVFYAGDITRPGCNASHQLVDEFIVGSKPESIDFTQAAALPLTSITAWEALFDRLKIQPDVDAGKSILIIGGAGGVGSIAIQLAKRVAQLNVIATASRDASREWCHFLGADTVINHYDDLVETFKKQKLDAPDYILCLNDTDHYFDPMVKLIAPQGMICAVVDTKSRHDITPLKSKSAGFVWEFMFTRSMFTTPDRIRQHKILNMIAELVDKNDIKSTWRETLGALSPETLRKAHQQLETGTTIGKIVLTQEAS